MAEKQKVMKWGSFMKIASHTKTESHAIAEMYKSQQFDDLMEEFGVNPTHVVRMYCDTSALGVADKALIESALGLEYVMDVDEVVTHHEYTRATTRPLSSTPIPPPKKKGKSNVQVV